MVKDSILVWVSKKVSLVREVSREGILGPGLGIETLIPSDNPQERGRERTAGRLSRLRQGVWTSSSLHLDCPEGHLLPHSEPHLQPSLGGGGCQPGPRGCLDSASQYSLHKSLKMLV